MNKTLCYNFARGSGSLLCHVNKFNEYHRTIATYGVLRGTLETINRVKNYYYIDHGYFNQSKRQFENNRTNVINLDGYFRIVYNFIHNGTGNYPDDRLKKLNIDILDQKSSGDFIIISEPSEVMKKFTMFPSGQKHTIKLVKKHTDRKIIIHNKFSKEPLDFLLKNAWAFVSLQSTAGFKAMQKGSSAFLYR